MTNSVTMVYLITSVFGTHIIYRFMKIFFDCNKTDRKIEFASYILYYFTIGYLFIEFNNPSVNVIANIVMFFLLTYNYESTLKGRLIATVSIYMILMTIEAIVVLALQYFNISLVSQNSDLELISAFITIKILTYNVMLFLSNFKLIRSDVKVSSLHWLSIFVIPSGTLVLALLMILKVNNDNLTEMIISIIILFVINVFVFYLYDALMKSYEGKLEKALLQQQSSAYLKQFEIINQSQENLKEFRHNIKNHILTFKTLIENNDNQSASEYLDSVYNNINFTEEYSKSSNYEIDSIINYKLNKAGMCGIKTYLSVNVPEKLNIKPFDLSVILGNLLDNAIEAAEKCKEKTIELSIELDRNVLYVSVSNSYDGTLNYHNGNLTTTKNDRENHGLGLSSVQKSLEKYNGAMDIRHTKNKFYADVLIYNQVYK